MRRKTIVLAVIAAGAARLAPGAESVAPPADFPCRPGEVIVQLQAVAAAGLQRAELDALLRWGGAVSAQRSAFNDGLYRVELGPVTSVETALARYRAQPEVEYAVPNAVVQAFFDPNDPDYARFQWNLRLLKMDRGWDIQKGKSSVIVAVIDSGVAFEDYLDPSGLVFRRAPDWAPGTFVTGFDSVAGRGAHANDAQGHGTHVASTIAEATNNGVGAAGMAFDVRIMPVRVLGTNGMGGTFEVAEGIDFAARNGAKVINLSLGSRAEAQAAGEPIRRAIDRAVEAGAVVVAATGNDNRRVGFPALLPNVIAVGAIGPDKRRAPYSNFGPEVDVVAPGGNLVDFGPAGGIWQQTYVGADRGAPDFTRFDIVPFQGTSMASPHVAALAALLVSQGLTDPAAVRAAIESTAEDLGPPGRDDQYGLGLIRPVDALTGLGFGR